MGGTPERQGAARPRTRRQALRDALLLGTLLTLPTGLLPLAAEELAMDPGLPAILSPEDVRLYREIFALQAAGGMGKAEALVERLADRRLIGHVLAQRYLHPTAYNSKFGELKDWLESHAELPQAPRIYELAQRKKKGSKNELRAPVINPASLAGPGRAAVPAYVSPETRDAKTRQRVKELKKQIRELVSDERLDKAQALVEGQEVQRLFDSVEIDQAFARIAQAWYSAGEDTRAFALAAPAGERSSAEVPIASWVAGLAAWRLDDLDGGARHFGLVARSSRISGWLASAGAYWAARTHLRRREPEQMSAWLSLGAKYPRTFYGQLAREALGLRTEFDFRTFDLTGPGLATLSASPAGSRAVALLQAGESELAEQELLLMADWDSASVTQILFAIADKGRLARFAFTLANRLADAEGNTPSGKPLLAALYPLPHWQPEGGYIVDRALVFALIRQESAFNPEATSHAGARGLLQIMPRTASYVSGNAALHGKGKNDLYDPQLNLRLGQEYLLHLMSLEEVGDNLFRLCAAYNGGPGNLAKWQRETKHADDPLLFIESIPFSETRDYVERVLANLWIYQARLEQDTPALREIANGDWPRYHAQDVRQAMKS